MRTCATLLSITALAGCAVDAIVAAADAGPGSDAGPEICDGVDRSCPDALPLQGGACAGELRCPYPELTSCSPPDGTELAATCESGRWQVPSFCLPAPVLAEPCRDPEVGPFPAHALALDAPLDAGFEWGLQGNAMISYRLSLEPAEGAPRCVRVRSRLTVDGESVETTRAIRLRCGTSLGILDVVPGLPCDDRDYPVTLEVEVIGAGTETVSRTLRGGRPPSGPPVCDTTG